MLASDGVWDVMLPEEVVAHVMESAAGGKTAKQAAEALVARAVEIGMKEAQLDYTSAAVVYL